MFGEGTVALARLATIVLAVAIAPMAASVAQPVDFNKHEKMSEMSVADLPAPKVEAVAVVEEPMTQAEQVEQDVPLEESVEYVPEPLSSNLTYGYDDYDYYVQEQEYYPSYSGYMQAGSAEDFMWQGIVTDGSNVFTWYSQSVLPGGGLHELNSNGRHVGDNGFVYDGDGYIALATDSVEMGSVIETPWGPGKVYDCGSGDIIDVYVR